MALQLISANRVESLLDKLAHKLVSPRLGSVFNAETIVVPSPAMGRWVKLQLACRHGVATNQQYPLPAGWIWTLTASLLEQVPAADPLDRTGAAWKIHGLLPELLELPAFHSLRHYLQEADDDLKRWQLSSRIADVFDRYQFYRPGLIRQWSLGDGADWQAMLWRKLIAPHPRTHRVAVLDRLLEKLHRHNPLNQLPERVSLFSLSTLPPLFIDVLHALAPHTEIALYLHSPTDQYWADLKSKKEISRIRVDSPDEAAYYETGNELLASWGRQGQALQDLLLSNDSLQTADWEDYRPPAADTLLSRIQQDIFSLRAPRPGIAVDDTLQVHACHSALRECQVLHDQLLKMLDQDDSLRPEDILVMVPEISRYAPYIEAVFRRDPGAARPFISWNLSDISITDEHPLMRSFFQLLKLPQSRLPGSEILSLLDVPELTTRFGLDQASCENVRILLEQTRVRWGIDEQQKTELGLPPTLENSWKQAEQRLFAGYALGDVDYWDDIAPVGEAEGGMADSMGKFWLLFDQLREYRRQLGRNHPAEEWQRLLNRMLDDFFTTVDEGDNRLQQIRDTLDDLQHQAGGQLLSPQLLCYCLETALGNQTVNGRYFSGGVTFCGMRPMRSLPFRVICLLGMNDQAFPRREQPAEFDRMADKWRPGDPRKGDEDRYLLLETLLCTRDKLYISYTGRDMKDNSERQPSVLVRELLDFVDRQYTGGDPGLKLLSQQLTRDHPLQAFSPRNYGNGIKSYDRYWWRIAQTVSLPPQPRSTDNWPSLCLQASEEESHDINLGRLLRFVRHPVKYFVSIRLKIFLTEEPVNEDEESFVLDGIQRWDLTSRLLRNFLDERPVSQGLLQAQGLLPHGALAASSFAEAESEASPIIEKLVDYRGCKRHPLLVDLATENGLRISGQVQDYHPGKGLLHYSASRLKGTLLLALWLEHLVLCASNCFPDSEHSTLVCKDESRQFGYIPSARAQQLLQPYLGYYLEGLRRPLPVLPEASYAWASAANAEQARKNAGERWVSANSYRNSRTDSDDPYIQLVLRGLDADPLKHPEFATLADAFYKEALQLGKPL